MSAEFTLSAERTLYFHIKAKADDRLARDTFENTLTSTLPSSFTLTQVRQLLDELTGDDFTFAKDDTLAGLRTVCDVLLEQGAMPCTALFKSAFPQR